MHKKPRMGVGWMQAFGIWCKGSPFPVLAFSPFALHICSGSVAEQHGIVWGLLDSFAIQLDGLSPLLAGKRLVGLLLDFLQTRRELHLGAVETWRT